MLAEHSLWKRLVCIEDQTISTLCILSISNRILHNLYWQCFTLPYYTTNAKQTLALVPLGLMVVPNLKFSFKHTECLMTIKCISKWMSMSAFHLWSIELRSNLFLDTHTVTVFRPSACSHHPRIVRGVGPKSEIYPRSVCI